jgi:hypothetical protein
MVDQRGELGFWKKVKNLGEGVVHDIAHSTKYIFVGMWELAFFVQKQLCSNWCSEGCYSLNVIQDGNNEVCKETLLIFLQLLYIVAKLFTCKLCSIFL